MSNEGEQEKLPPHLHFFRERSLKVITEDGAPTGEKIFVLWNPKVHAAEKTTGQSIAGNTQLNSIIAVDSVTQTGTRKRKRAAKANVTSTPPREGENQSEEATTRISESSIFQSAIIFSRLMEKHVHTILFCRGRKLSELVLMNVHSILEENKTTAHLLKRVKSYRGGYTVNDRRAIERQLFNGELLGVVATNALELGIDVGELDCTMHLGLPTSISSLWQQAGRAGRQHSQHSMAVIVCFDSPLDQYFARHPRELFELKPESVCVNPSNPKVLKQHLLCAARELALFSTQSGMKYVDPYIFGGSPEDSASVLADTLEFLVRDNKLMVSPTKGKEGYTMHVCVPQKARAVNIRSISEIVYKVGHIYWNAFSMIFTCLHSWRQVVTDDQFGQVLDEISGDRVFFQVYPGGIYLHQAQEYLVARVDSEQRIAFVKKCLKKLNYFTACRDYTEIDIVHVNRQLRVADSLLVHLGVVSVLTYVFGSSMLEKRTMRVLNMTEFSLPPMKGQGNALWLDMPTILKDQVESAGYAWLGALHGVGHLLLSVVRLFVLCDPADLNTQHYNPYEKRSRYL